MNVLSFLVFDGDKWLAEDEHHWTADFGKAAAFASAKLAQDIGEREARRDTQTIYVMGCIGLRGEHGAVRHRQGRLRSNGKGMTHADEAISMKCGSRRKQTAVISTRKRWRG